MFGGLKARLYTRQDFNSTLTADSTTAPLVVAHPLRHTTGFVDVLYEVKVGWTARQLMTPVHRRKSD